MEANKKYMIFAVILFITLIFINFKFNNIIVKTYYYLKTIPKILMVGGTILFIVSPFLFKKKQENFIDNVLTVVENTTGQDLNIIKNFTPKFEGKHKRNVSDKTKKYVAAQQQWKCKMCNGILDETYEVDHIKRLADGGSNEADNLQALCPNCHRKKTFHEA